MPPKRKLGKRLVRSLLPILLVILVAVLVSVSFIVYCISRPAKSAYLVTPQSFSQISSPALKVTDETWTNRDGTLARGWLLKGAAGAPAVVLLHRYGADRSYSFNLGVKINETTSFTILWPDMRGHGLNPLVKWSSLSGRDDDDLLAAIDFLRSLKSDGKTKLVGDRYGVYGVELGAYAALKAAQHDSQIKVLALDSIPRSSTELIDATVSSCTGFDNRVVKSLTAGAVRIYMLGAYKPTTACDIAASLREQRVMLLSGADAGYLISSTASLKNCFPNPANVEIRTDLPLSGLNLISATGEQGESYDRIVIDFLDKYLR
jgi:pimeloyl-ACP methyl ester carboxylesterase